jgi:hypothetical protein
MANRILTEENWQQRIRDKLGVDAAYLPDTVIQQPDIITVAETNIIEQIPNYASLEDDKKVYLEAAVVCECAALLCPSMPARLPITQQGPHESHQLYIDWDKKKANFETDRDGYIGKAIDHYPTLFHFGISQ